MSRWSGLVVVTLLVATGSVSAAGLTGKYLEVRTCDIWTAPCFANAEIGLAGKEAVMAWRVEQGSLDGVDLKGLGVVAVVAASDTLGQQQTGLARAILIVDAKANRQQHDALVRFAKRQGGELLQHVIAVHSAPIELSVRDCNGGTCARMKAGSVANIETRCIDTEHDKACGNEGAFYPPLAKNTKAQAAVAVEHGFSGKDFNQTWKETDRRGAYVGSFEVR
jgi:hypothetical protein